MRRLAVVVQDASDAIILQDLEGHILAWNPRAERIYGWSEAEALKMNISSLVPESRKEEELAMLKKLSRLRFWNLTAPSDSAKDGRIVEVWLTATSLVNEADEVYAIATTEREIKSENMKKEGHD